MANFLLDHLTFFTQKPITFEAGFNSYLLMSQSYKNIIKILSHLLQLYIRDVNTEIILIVLQFVKVKAK